MLSPLNAILGKADGATLEPHGGLPRIGISANRKDGTSCIAEPYYKSVAMAGGAPVLVPVTTDAAALAKVVDCLDGLILSGGGDIDAQFLGERPIPELGEPDILRDEYDFLLLRLAFNRQLPIFGICRGHQLINVAFGGSIYQDIHAQYSKDALNHSQEEPRDVPTHEAALKKEASAPRSPFSALNSQSIQVNSFHHQAVKNLAPEFIELAQATDGLNEAMMHREYPIFSVQWHPEAMAAAGNETMLGLFRHHTQMAAVFAKAKALHHKILAIDSHTDTPMLFKDFDLSRKQGGKVNIPLMAEGRIDAAFMAAYIPQGGRDGASLQKAHDYAVERLSKITEQERLFPRLLGIARSEADLTRLKAQGKKALFLAVENGYAIGKDLANLKRFKDMGVSYITLCHNGDNDICDSAAGNGEWGGLSPFGREVVAEMNRLGIMIDVSHAAESTFYDVLECSRKPVIASHSSCRALCGHPRNLYDAQIRALAAHGGVVQICLYKGFISANPDEATLSDAVKHILHAIGLAGIDCVGIGSDFDGDGEIIGCRAANELLQITMRLIAEGLSDEDIAKVWGGNLMRVMNEAQKNI